MSNTIQTLDSIKPMNDEHNALPSDPVKKEYEEGKRFLENGELGQAAVALHNALVGFEEKGDEIGIANASNQLGHLCLVRKEYTNSLQHYERALAICDSNNDPMSILAVKKKLVDVQRGLGNHQAALGICLDILDIYHDNRDPQGTVDILEVMADIYQAAEEPHKAADAYRTISSIHANFNHTASAESYLEKAKQLESQS